MQRYKELSYASICIHPEAVNLGSEMASPVFSQHFAAICFGKMFLNVCVMLRIVDL